MSSLANSWRSCGVNLNDTLLLHSSAKRTLQTHQITPAELIESFLEAIGPKGNLLLPVFNFGWCRGEPFDIRTTPGETGILGNTAMRWPGAVRTRHPVYGFMVIGPAAQDFRDGVKPTTYDTPGAYGHGSPFEWLRMVGGKIGVLDLPDQNSQTFYHHCEETAAAKWRMHKAWTNDYTDAAGDTTRKTYSIYVRQPGVLTHVDPCGELLWKAGLYKGERPHVGTGLRTIDAQAMWTAVTGLIAQIHQGAASHKLLYLHDEQDEFDGVCG